MVFCGQCGLQLSPGMVRCPRCGAETEVAMDSTIQPPQADAPTIEATYVQHSPATAYPPQQAFPATPQEPQKLVLRPSSGGNYDFMPAGDNEQTSAMDAPVYPSYGNGPTNFRSGGQYPSPSPAPNYPVQSSTLYQSQAGNFATPVVPQPAAIPPGRMAPSGYPSQQKKRRGGGIVTLLVVVGLLLVLGAGGFFVVQRSHLLGNTTNPVTGGSNGGGTTQNPPLTPTEHAKAVVQHYYAAINNKNYPEAYSLWHWGVNGPSLTSFENGYANTEHDNLTIRSATQLSDGTVKVVMIVVATESVNGTIRHRTYAGYYDVGQDGGTWKIFRGYLTRTR